jgi:hypothetical protein
MTTCTKWGAPPASSMVDGGVQFMQTNAQGWANQAANLASALAGYGASPINFTPPSFPSLHFESFIKPGRPGAWREPPLTSGAPPSKVTLTTTEFFKPTGPGVAPDSVEVNMPTMGNLIGDTLVPPRRLPIMLIPDQPVYYKEPLPEVPTLRELNLPEEPTITLEDFGIERPDFESMLPPTINNNYYADVDTRRAQALVELRDSDLDGAAVRARWNEMILGGTGLPVPIEQALFERGIGRETQSSQQAVNQAHQEWAARGFSLPGSTLLARVSEARNTNRAARAQINRELTIQYHEKEIENLRFAVQQGVALEGQWTAQFTQTYDLARQTADGFYRVAVAVLESQISYLRAQIDVYQADIQAFRDRIQIELAKLEVYRAQLEGQRLINELNKMDVDIYLGQLQAVKTAADVYQAEISGFRAAVDAEVAKIQGFRASVDAYSALLQTDRITADVYTAKVSGEEAKVRVYTSEVQAFAERVRAYSAEVQAESSRVDAVTRIDEARVRQYVAETDAWRSQVQTDIERIRAAVNIFEAETGRYSAELSAESARVQGESRNVEIAANRTNAQAAAALKQADQQIEQMRHITSLAVASLEGAARTYSQLAASALSAVNLSASVSHGHSTSNSTSCQTSYSYSGEI